MSMDPAEEAGVKKYLERLLAEQPKGIETIERFAKFVSGADDMVEIVLKCHLLIEESLTRIIWAFVHEPDFLDDARLTFSQKIGIARSMSLGDSRNPMWSLVIGFKRIRNDYGHFLEPEKAPEHIRDLRAKYLQVFRDNDRVHKTKDQPDEPILKEIANSVIGFLLAFEAEVERFRHYVSALDRILNPHRHTKPAENRGI